MGIFRSSHGSVSDRFGGSSARSRDAITLILIAYAVSVSGQTAPPGQVSRKAAAAKNQVVTAAPPAPAPVVAAAPACPGPAAGLPAAQPGDVEEAGDITLSADAAKEASQLADIAKAYVNKTLAEVTRLEGAAPLNPRQQRRLKALKQELVTASPFADTISARAATATACSKEASTAGTTASTIANDKTQIDQARTEAQAAYDS
jgi:pyruvate dehydrogenase E2 component (dihydrolipoamide acetyltransferase)